MLDIRQNVEGVQAAIERACRRCGRDPREVLLIAVSKTVDLERIRLAVEAGVPALGENRVQEAKEKVATLGHPVPWHLIGSLQTNKAKDAVRIFDCIQSVDRLELAHELDRRAQAAGRVVDGLLQVNLGEEPQKGGLPPAEVKAVLDQVAALQGLRIRGLMAIPPLVPDAEAARPYFRRLRELRDAVGLEHLSMGMSGDFEVAIDEGATMVRVGTAIFGPRQGPRLGRPPGGSPESGAGVSQR
ncbi:MAG: YggS family pyridoxal phosphate-dependent enzyme [Candidatus Rokubacteria bacterium]|nr:YggS family pyridoxal phosphate-dependent enzyme [Candidatus Rokubacteria bacterium]